MEDELEAEPEIFVRTLLPAAPRDGGVVHVLVQVVAPPRPDYRIRELNKEFNQEFGRFNALCWHSVSLVVKPSSDVLSIDPIPPDHDPSAKRIYYSLADLRFGCESSILLRFHVKPSDEEFRSLFTLRVRGTCDRHSCMHDTGGPGPDLENVDAETWATLPEDEVVAARLLGRL